MFERQVLDGVVFVDDEDQGVFGDGYADEFDALLGDNAPLDQVAILGGEFFFGFGRQSGIGDEVGVTADEVDVGLVGGGVSGEVAIDERGDAALGKRSPLRRSGHYVGGGEHEVFDWMVGKWVVFLCVVVGDGEVADGSRDVGVFVAVLVVDAAFGFGIEPLVRDVEEAGGEDRVEGLRGGGAVEFGEAEEVEVEGFGVGDVGDGGFVNLVVTGGVEGLGEVGGFLELDFPKGVTLVQEFLTFFAVGFVGGRFVKRFELFLNGAKLGVPLVLRGVNVVGVFSGQGSFLGVVFVFQCAFLIVELLPLVIEFMLWPEGFDLLVDGTGAGVGVVGGSGLGE